MANIRTLLLGVPLLAIGASTSCFAAVWSNICSEEVLGRDRWGVVCLDGVSISISEPMIIYSTLESRSQTVRIFIARDLFVFIDTVQLALEV